MNEFEIPKVNDDIRKLLDVQYRAKLNRPSIIDADSRRCNRCGKRFPENETVLVLAKPDSLRKHRLCIRCHLELGAKTR